MRRLLALFIILIVAGCAGVPTGSPGAKSKPSPGRTPIVSPTPGATATSSESTDGLGPFGCAFPYSLNGSTDRAQISGVQMGGHTGYDRIVFEFRGVGATAAIPQLEIRVGTPPFTKDPSGLPISLSGASFLVFTLRGGTTVDPNGSPTYTGTTDFKPDLPILQELALAGDFEALSTWIAGLARPACVRVTALAGPNRLVIDLAAK